MIPDRFAETFDLMFDEAKITNEEWNRLNSQLMSIVNSDHLTEEQKENSGQRLREEILEIENRIAEEIRKRIQ